MIRALEASRDHWKEICKVVSKGSLEFSIASSECACCLKYCTGDNYCKGCPLKEEVEHTRNRKEDWCCGGRWAGVFYAKPVVNSNNVNFFLLLKRCNEVLSYIGEKLDEAKGTFGVGDIVYYEGGHGNAICKVKGISGDFYYCYTATGKDMHGAFLASSLKPIFPANYPKELDGIRCESKGDVVELKTGGYGMVTSIDNLKSSISVLHWFAATKEFGNQHLFRREIKRVIWPCGKGE